MNESILQLEKISTHYGALKVLDGFSLALAAGEIVALMGPNGAGKSTVLKTIFGLAPLSHGHIRYHGQPLTPVPHEVVQAGIAFVPQGRRVFSNLTVEENLEMGGFAISSRAESRRRIEEIYKTFPVLHKKRSDASHTLSGGQQQLLALARGLMTEPHILLLDEPTLGLSPIMVKEIFDAVRLINERHGTTILIVEHNLKSLLHFVSRAYVLVAGQNFTEGTPRELEKSGVLERAFLGNK
jgi:branched-chain amino acid transport system ATP-binding protein